MRRLMLVSSGLTGNGWSYSSRPHPVAGLEQRDALGRQVDLLNAAYHPWCAVRVRAGSSRERAVSP
jgi:hypothetical protein